MGNNCETEEICSGSILRVSRVFGLLFAKNVYFDYPCNLRKYHHNGFESLHFDSRVFEFISQSSDLLLEDATNSTNCQEHVAKYIPISQLKNMIYAPTFVVIKKNPVCTAGHIRVYISMKDVKDDWND